MAKGPKRPAGGFESENAGGFLSGFLAEENQFDRRALWSARRPALAWFRRRDHLGPADVPPDETWPLYTSDPAHALPW